MSQRCVWGECKAWAIKGGTVCGKHGGARKDVRALANVRAEVSKWTLGDATLDPGEVLLRLVTQSSARADLYSTELEKLVDESPSLREALVADVWASSEHGDAYKAGEYIRGLASLEAQERDRCANFCVKAIAAGLAERQVRLAENQGKLVAGVIKAILGDLGLSDEQAALVGEVVPRHLRALTA